MKTLFLLVAGIAFALEPAFAQTETPTAPGPSSVVQLLVGNWLPQGVEPMDPGINPDAVFNAAGLFRITAQDGVQLHGTYKIREEGGQRIISMEYKEPDKTLEFQIIELNEQLLKLKKISSGSITVYDRVTVKSVPNPNLSN